MKDVLVLRDLEQIKALAHPYRLEIIERFEDEPCTAKQIADKLNEPHAKVNYHIKTLVKVGILELHKENIKLGIVEKYYVPTAKNYIIDRNILNLCDNSILETLSQASLSLFESISKDFYSSIGDLNEADYPRKFLCCYDYYLTDEELKELHRKIKDTLGDYLQDKKDRTRDESKRYSIYNVMLPRIQQD